MYNSIYIDVFFLHNPNFDQKKPARLLKPLWTYPRFLIVFRRFCQNTTVHSKAAQISLQTTLFPAKKLPHERQLSALLSFMGEPVLLQAIPGDFPLWPFRGKRRKSLQVSGIISSCSDTSSRPPRTPTASRSPDTPRPARRSAGSRTGRSSSRPSFPPRPTGCPSRISGCDSRSSS